MIYLTKSNVLSCISKRLDILGKTLRRFDQNVKAFFKIVGTFFQNDEFLSKNQAFSHEVIKLSTSFVGVADVTDDFRISATV